MKTLQCFALALFTWLEATAEEEMKGGWMNGERQWAREGQRWCDPRMKQIEQSSGRKKGGYFFASFFHTFCPQIMSDYRRCCSVTARSANFCCTLTPSRHLQLLISPSYSTNGYEGQLYVLQTSTSGSWSIDEFKQLWPTLVCFSILLACQLFSVVLAHRFPSEDIKQVINLYF